MLVRFRLLAFAVPGFIATATARTQTLSGPPRPHDLKGIVIDIARTPIARVEIVASTGRTVFRQAMTEKDGSFNLGTVPTGSLSLRIRQLGYEPRAMELQIGSEQPAALEIVLTANATELKEVVVKAQDVGPLDEFNDHRKNSRGAAKFFDQEEIRRRGAMYPSDLFRTMPGVLVKSGMAGGNTIRIRGCQPVVWVDGQRVPDAELDDVATPGDIAGIEFYPSMAGTPPKYGERSALPCGTLLVWTKSR